MFELWQTWNSDWTKKHEEGLAYNKQKDALANTTDTESLTNNFNNLKSYTPYESDSVVTAAAQMNVTPNQYYDIYKNTNTLYKKKQDGKNAIDRAKDWLQENGPQILEDSMMPKRFTKGFKEGFFVVVDQLAQLVDRSFANFAVSMASYEDEIYRRKGESREANIEFEQKGINKNQREFRHKFVQAEAFIKSFFGYGVERAFINANKLDNIFLPEKYEVDPYANTPYTDRANAYLMAKGAVDENGVPLMQQADATALYNALKLDVMDEVAALKKQGKDVNTQDYMEAVSTAWVNEAVGDYQDGQGFMEWFNFSDAVAENRIRNEMLEEFQISTNIGDFASYLFTGNMPGRYSPENVYYEDTQKEYDDKILATEMAFRDGRITVDQKNEYINNLEQQKDDALNDIAFEPNKGASGVLGGLLNIYKYYWTDPFILYSKGLGLGGRVADDAADVFASAQKRIKQFIDEGGGDEKAFWAQPENDEVLDGIADLVVAVNNKEGSTALLDYVNLGVNVKFAAKLADATDAGTVKQYLVDGIDKGYLSDMVYGTQSIGNAGQYRIQSKVLNSNFLKGLADADVDDGVTALGWRGGSRKSNSLFKNIKELFNATDVRLAVTGEIDLNNINEAATLFARMGNLLKVPESRLNKLLTDFYAAVNEGRHFAAQEIYWDGLIRGEGALQMKYLYGFGDDEIAEMFGTMGTKHRMYSDQTASFVNPSKTSKFYSPDEIHIFAKRQAAGQFKGDIPQEFLKQTLELFSDFKMNTLEIPDLITLIKATTQKRRLRAKVLIEKEGIDKVFDTARKAFDDGKSGTFWDADTPLGKIVSEVMDEVADPSALFTKTESTLSAIEKGVFGGVRSVFYPLQLLFRLSYPAKLALEGNMRVAIFGARSIFRSPIGFFRHMLNDPDGNLARIFNIDVTTSLQGPFVKRRPKEFGGSLATLNDKLPLSVRRFLGVFVDNSDYGFSELGQATSASPMWTFRRNRGQGTQHELINKRGQIDVPVDDGVQDFVLDGAYVDSFAEFMFKYMDDDMAAITAGLILKGYSVEDIALYYQKTPAVRQLIEEGNKMMQNRNIYQGGTLPIVTKTEDFADLARHYKQLIDNYTGQHQEFIEIIATGKVNSHDLRGIETTTDNAYDAYYAYVKPKVIKYQDDLPNQIPRAIKEEDAGTKFQNFMDALFYATAQVEADLIRIPFIRQAYDHFVEAGIPFMTPAALAKALKNHSDNLIPVNLSDDIMDLVRAEYDKVKNIAADISVTEKTVPIKIFENKVDGVVDSYSLIAYSPEGQLTITSLKNLSKSNDSIVLDLNIYDAELKVFKKQSVVAEYRLGDDGEKIGVYNLKLNANETVVNGVLTDFQKTSLTNQLSKVLDKQTNVDVLIDEALEYLADTQSLTTVLDKATLFKLLGLDNYNHNLQGYAYKLRKGKVKTVNGKTDVGPATLNRVIGKKSSRRVLMKQTDIEDAIDKSYKWIKKNPDGWSLDLGRKKYNRIPGFYLSVYGTKGIVIPKDDLTREVLEKFIKDNKTFLKKQDHVLGGWVDDDGMLHLDVSIRIKRGVSATAENGTDEALAKAQYLAILADQQSISNISSKGVVIINTMDNHAAFDVVRREGQDLLIGAQKKVLRRTQPVVGNATDLKVVGNDVLEGAGIRAILDQKGGTVEILKPYNNPITNQRTFSGDYQSMLDLEDIKSSTTNRVMSYEDLHERAVEYAMEIHSRVLYNLVERGYFSQAYRIGFAFFEAYREVLGRYMNLAIANPKAAAQLQLAYRKGLEENYIYTDDTGDQYLIVPVGGTPFEDLVKSEGRGMFTDDMAVNDSKIIAKRTFPISSLLVGGGGLFPPLGPALALGIGPLLNDKPQLKRVLQKTIFGGFPIESAEAETYFSTEFIAAIGRTTMPSVGKNLLQTIATKFGGTYGMDEDAWLSSTTTAFQIAGLIRPDLADNPDELEEVAMVLATNIYQLKTYDRFINPFVPRLTTMYAIEGNEAVFWDWFGKEGEDTSLAYNNFVEISAIHGFYQDLRDEYTLLLGAQGEYYALYEMTKLFGLDKNSLSEDFTAAALQVKGKNISEGGRLPRTRPEYDFVLDNPELAAEYGPVLVYFAQGLDSGATDMGTMDYIKNLGLFRPKTANEFYFSVQTFLASAIESGQKDYWGTVIDNSTLDPTTRRLRRQAKFAEIDANLRKLFPMAYGNSAELNKVLGFDYEAGVPNDVMIDYFTRAINDPRFKDFEMTNTLKVYIRERDIAISAIMKSENKTRQQAINFIIRGNSDGAQRVREQLFTKAQEIGRNNPLFLVVFNEVFSYELTRFGIEG